MQSPCLPSRLAVSTPSWRCLKEIKSSLQKPSVLSLISDEASCETVGVEWGHCRVHRLVAAQSVQTHCPTNGLHQQPVGVSEILQGQENTSSQWRCSSKEHYQKIQLVLEHLQHGLASASRARTVAPAVSNKRLKKIGNARIVWWWTMQTTLLWRSLRPRSLHLATSEDCALARRQASSVGPCALIFSSP